MSFELFYEDNHLNVFTKLELVKVLHCKALLDMCENLSRRCAPDQEAITELLTAELSDVLDDLSDCLRPHLRHDVFMEVRFACQAIADNVYNGTGGVSLDLETTCAAIVARCYEAC